MDFHMVFYNSTRRRHNHDLRCQCRTPTSTWPQEAAWPTWIQIAEQITDTYTTLILVTWVKDINMIYNCNNVLDQNVPPSAEWTTDMDMASGNYSTLKGKKWKFKTFPLCYHLLSILCYFSISRPHLLSLSSWDSCLNSSQLPLDPHCFFAYCYLSSWSTVFHQ